MPVAGTALLVGALLVAGWITARPGRAGRVLVSILCLAAAAAVELADRRMYPAEYPDLHAFLVPVSLLLTTAGVRVGLAPGARTPDRGQAAPVLLWAFMVAAVGVGLGLSLLGGLELPASRWALATRGAHARHLVRLVRARLDGDGDGFSPVLGGGDCNDHDAAVNPGAVEVPRDHIDQDCDGADQSSAPLGRGQAAAAARRAQAAFLASPAGTRLLRQASGWNLLFLSVDALRADVVADTPDNRAAYPHLFALFDRSRRFQRAFAPAAGTDLSVSSVLTGRVNPFQQLATTLPEAIRASGRATFAVLPREVLRYAGKTLLTRGFDHVDVVVNDKVERDVSMTTTSAGTTRLGLAALDHLATGKQPFFLWLHYFDVHEHMQIHKDDPALRKAAQSGGFDLATTAGDYRALVGVIDVQIGRVLDELDRRGLADRTVIVLFSDHGESLGEDPRLPDNHGRFLYAPLTRVPLAIHLPGGAAGPSDQPVTLLDLAPTLTSLFGATRVAGDAPAGRSLLRLLAAGAPAALPDPPRALPLNETEQWGVVEWPEVLLVRPADNLVELYDLARDPGEHANLAALRPADVRRLKALYRGFPTVVLDRSRKGREMRERRARPPRSH